MLDPCDMESFRRRSFGSRIISWATIKNNPPYQSFETMANCLKYPTKLVRWNFGQDREITIEIDWGKVENAQQNMHPTSGSLPGLKAVSTPENLSAIEVLSTPPTCG